MAVVALLSTSVTAQDAGTPVAVTDHGGRVRQIAATIELANGDSIGSTYRMARVRSNWRIAAIWLFCDAITSGAADVGLYQTAANGGAVVDADAYTPAQSIATALVKSPVNVAFGAAGGTRNIDKVNNRVWQDAGLSADSNREYDIALTLTAATTAAGTVSVIVEYVID